jgi:hypothetical protein
MVWTDILAFPLGMLSDSIVQFVESTREQFKVALVRFFLRRERFAGSF